MDTILDFLNDNKDAFSSLGTIFALVIFGFAVFQYRRGEQWKKSEFIAKLYKDFVDDPACQRAMWMLDWEDRPVNFGSDEKPDIHAVTERILTGALRRHDNTEFSILEMNIRDTFDLFFSHVEQFERAIKNKLVRQNEVYPYFAYWIEMLQGKRHMKVAVRNAVLGYIDAYGFDDVRRFLARWPA